jgi:hypothetical protein
MSDMLADVPTKSFARLARAETGLRTHPSISADIP